MVRIKFYSEYDLACGADLKEIVERINHKDVNYDWDISDLLEFYNILKYIKIKRFSEFIVQNTGVDIDEYESEIKKKIGTYIGQYKTSYINLFNEVDIEYQGDFFEVIEIYKLYRNIDTDNFRIFFMDNNLHVRAVLKYRGITQHFDEIIKCKLLSDENNVEVILAKYLKEEELYFPLSLNDIEIINLICKYIDSPTVNINVLRRIINLPPNKGLIIPDKIKLNAKRREQKEELIVFNEAKGIETSVRITYEINQEEAIIRKIKNGVADIKVSTKWLKDNLDYPTLWNNFIYLFQFVDETMRLNLVSKKSDSSALEMAFREKAEYLFYKSSHFQFMEMLSTVELYSYVDHININGVSLENMFEWFFRDYIKYEFNIDNFIIRMPSSEASYFEKCKYILPEIDRIIKQYNILIEEGEIDQELVQLSSSSVKIKDVKSFNEKKYVYSSSEWYKKASFLLFSDQSRIFYIKDNDKQYKNFFELVIREKHRMYDLQQYQLREIQWLIDNQIIYLDDNSYFRFSNKIIIYIISELYYKEVISYWHCEKNIQEMIDKLNDSNNVHFGYELLSINEQDYFDFYLNKAKFTNGYEIRNKYIHGTDSNDEKQSKSDYYTILKLLVILVIKINDDLCIRANNSKI